MAARVLCVLCLSLWLWNRQGFAKMDNASLTFKHIIDNMLDNGSYDPTIRPLYDVGNVMESFRGGAAKTKYVRDVNCNGLNKIRESLKVEIDIVLNTLGPVVAREMEISASFYLRQQWRDPRLAYNGVNRSILLSHRRMNSIWVPDLFFSQSKHEQNYDITVPNVLIRVHPDGTILYSQRISVTFQCLMDLRKFPLDKQTCSIRMESYSHTTEDMYFLWSSKRKSMDVMSNAHVPDFEISDITTHDCTATYATGTFPCLEARLTLHRQIGFYMTQTYVPCVLIVSLSWVSFWLDTQAIPARISVGLLTVLTITTQSSGVRSELPRVPYTKAIDVWMSVCLVFVFAAYMQYAFVTVFSRRHRKTNGLAPYSETYMNYERTASIESVISSRSMDQPSCSVYMGNVANGKPAFVKRRPTLESARRRRSSVFQLDHESRDIGRVMDKWSRAMFPLTFFIFNIVYWVYYGLTD